MGSMRITLKQAEIINSLMELLECSEDEILGVCEELVELYKNSKTVPVPRNEFGYPTNK